MPEPGSLLLFHLNEQAREDIPSNGWWLVLGQFCTSPSDEKGKAMQETKLYPYLSQMLVSEQKFATDLQLA